MRDAAAAGRPFAKEHEALRARRRRSRRRRPIAGPVERTAALAEKGVPTIAALRERFDAVARAVAIAARGGDDADWIQRMKGRVFSLVPCGAPTAPRRRARRRLIWRRKRPWRRAISPRPSRRWKHSGPPAVPARDWLGVARARVDLDAALAEMHARAVAVLAGGADPSVRAVRYLIVVAALVAARYGWPTTPAR